MVSHKVYVMDCLLLSLHLSLLLSRRLMGTVRLCHCATLDALPIFRAKFLLLVFAPKCPYIGIKK